MDSAKKPEDMNSEELKKHLAGGTVGGTTPSASGDVKPKKLTKKAAAKSVAVKVKVKGKEVIGHALKSDLKKAKPAPKKAKTQAKKSKAKAKKPARANLSLIDLDKLKALVKVKGGATVPKLMKALRQPRINVSRALARLGKLVKVTAKRAPHEGKPGQRPFIYTLG